MPSGAVAPSGFGLVFFFSEILRSSSSASGVTYSPEPCDDEGLSLIDSLEIDSLCLQLLGGVGDPVSWRGYPSSFLGDCPSSFLEGWGPFRGVPRSPLNA